MVLSWIGTIAGVLGVAVAIASWLRAGKALRAQEMEPVRAAQHALIDKLEPITQQLVDLLENKINYDLQRRDDSASIEQNVDQLETLVRLLTAHKVVDPELQQELSTISRLTFGDGTSTDNWVERLRGYARLISDIEAAVREGQSGPGSELLRLGEQRGHLQEPLRSRNGEVSNAARRANKRIGHLRVSGFGDLSRAREKVAKEMSGRDSVV